MENDVEAVEGKLLREAETYTIYTCTAIRSSVCRILGKY